MSGEDKKIQKITKLLEKGGTMLATHHDCGAPMFRYQGNILCPVCDFREAQGTGQVLKAEPGQLAKIPVLKEAPGTSTSKPRESFEQVAILTRSKILEIAAGLESETDLERVKRKMECIELGIRILNLLEEKI